MEPLIDPEEEAKIKSKMLTLLKMVHEKLPKNLKESLHPGVGKSSCQWGYLTEKKPPVYHVHYNFVIGSEGLTVGVVIESVKLLPNFLDNLSKNRDQFLAILEKCKDCKLRIFVGLKKGKYPKPKEHDTIATFDVKYVDESVIDFVIHKLKWKIGGKIFPRIRLFTEIGPTKIFDLQEEKDDALVDKVVDIVEMLEPYYEFVKQ